MAPDVIATLVLTAGYFVDHWRCTPVSDSQQPTHKSHRGGTSMKQASMTTEIRKTKLKQTAMATLSVAIAGANTEKG